MTLSTHEIALLREEAEASMRDKCRIGTAAVAEGNNPTDESWSYSDTEIACGFDASRSKEVHDGSQATLTDAVLRLPIASVITGKNRVRVTERNGEDVSEDYAVIGEPRRGLTALVVGLRRVVGGSTL